MYKETINTLPIFARLATINDFIRKLKIQDEFVEKRMTGLKYFVHSFYSSKYEIYILSDTTNIEQLKPFFDNNRIYVIN
jgi:hypothetical protein